MISTAIERDFLTATARHRELVAQAARQQRYNQVTGRTFPLGANWRRTRHRIGAACILLRQRLQGFSPVSRADPLPEFASTE
jgi:hypothetical protein